MLNQRHIRRRLKASAVAEAMARQDGGTSRIKRLKPPPLKLWRPGEPLLPAGSVAGLPAVTMAGIHIDIH